MNKIHGWATTEHVRRFLTEEFGIKRIPCYWWLLPLLGMVKPESLNLCMKKWGSSQVPHLVSKIEAEESNQKARRSKTPTIAIEIVKKSADQNTPKIKQLLGELPLPACIELEGDLRSQC